MTRAYNRKKTTNAKTAPKQDAPAKTGRTGNTIVLANPVQVALFRDALLPEIINEGGRWNKVRPFDHAIPFQGSIKIVSRREDEPLGVNFHASKLNYNFNDSHWVNDDEVTPRLLAVASKAAKREVSKKELYNELASIKEILKASPKVEATPEVGAGAQGNQPVAAAEPEKESAPADAGENAPTTQHEVAA